MMASRSHYRLLSVPKTLGIEAAYYVIYEKLQQDPQKEVENVLRAVGVASPSCGNHKRSFHCLSREVTS